MSAILQLGREGIRQMTDEDLSAVMAIETSIYPFPWTHGIFMDCMRVGYRCHVYEEAGEVVAYSVLSVGAGEAHILTICVHKDCQRHGVGRMMMEHMVEMAFEAEVESILLEVRPSNHVAVRLYERLGFVEVGTRPDYYPAENGRENALIMARQLHLV